LEPLIRRNVAAGRLRFTTDIDAGVAHGTLQFIAVGTPPDEDGSADMQYVLAAARSIGSRMNDFRIVVDKSTVPVGTADRVRAAIADELLKRRAAIPFAVVSNPEFLKEGAAVDDFMRPDRVVVGADDERAIAAMRAVYAPFMRSHERLLVMDVRSAELTKYAANAMLATRISFMNELANLADDLGADVELVRQGIGSDPRIGYHFLYPGIGYGGSCFPKDVKALLHTAAEHRRPLRVLAAVEAANDAQKHRLVDKIVARLGADLAGRRFALWGLAFKPNTDDMREAPAREVIAELVKRGATVAAYDPVAMTEAKRVLGDIGALTLVTDPMAALKGADALIVATEWKEFRSPDFDAIRALLTEPLVFDGRNLYEPAQVRAAGLEYFAIGRR
jgi:UDPglucose 6-dehydrogenase